jgi:CRISPR-associated protein Cas5d
MALFTRPEFKVERVSYDVMPPTAAVGLLDSILWKPEFAWIVERIAVLNPIRFISVRRNEVTTGFPIRPSAELPNLDISNSDNRVQRHSMILREVDYLISARIALTQRGVDGGNSVTKYTEIFRRRVTKGQHFRVPCFGCREFVATISHPDPHLSPIKDDRVLGLMPLIMDYGTEGPVPRFFPAMMIQGVVEVPTP